MSITLTSAPISASAALQPADVEAIINALTPVVTLPSGESTSNIVALNLTIQPSGAGVLNVRFSK